jgi:hypothetical protein
VFLSITVAMNGRVFIVEPFEGSTSVPPDRVIVKVSTFGARNWSSQPADPQLPQYPILEAGLAGENLEASIEPGGYALMTCERTSSHAPWADSAYAPQQYDLLPPDAKE